MPTLAVHRDVKPENMLLVPSDDGEPHVKVLDFGLARFAGEPVPRGEPLAGTPAYMAPERAAGQPGGPTSDLWAVGVLLYEMLSGALPFEGGARSRRSACDVPRPGAPSLVRWRVRARARAVRRVDSRCVPVPVARPPAGAGGVRLRRWPLAIVVVLATLVVVPTAARAANGPFGVSLDADAGARWLGLETFQANRGTMTAGVVPTSALGPTVGVGVGMRLLIFTLGRRGREAARCRSRLPAPHLAPAGKARLARPFQARRGIPAPRDDSRE